MARKFAGSAQYGTVSEDLTSYSVISVAFWGWWDTYATDSKLFFHFGAGTGDRSGCFFQPNSGNSGGTFELDFFRSGPNFWADRFTRPSAGAWHHYVSIYNRAIPANAVYVDGVSQSLTTIVHNGGAWGNFANDTLGLMCRPKATPDLIGNGRLAEFAIWGGITLAASEAVGLANGWPAPRVHPDSLIFYAPLYGADSPEPDYAGAQHSVTITAATSAQHPAVAPGFSLQRGFQPMPV